MPVTALDPGVALIVIDLQKGMLGMPFTPPFAEVVARTQTLLARFRRLKLPVVLVNVAGAAPGRTEQPPRVMELPAGWTELLDELGRHPQDILVTKHTRGAFTNTRLEHQLRMLGITQVVLTGVATASGVEATAHQAYEAGFHVTLAVDAMADVRPEAHAYSLAHVFPRIGETGTTQEILNLLQERSVTA